MVPMRLAAYDSCPPAETSNVRPQLILTDVTQDVTAKPRRAVRARRSNWSRLENLLIAAALTTTFFFFTGSFIVSLVHSVQTRYSASGLPPVVTISQTVARGDTLAKLASRYGNPAIYILAREDQIARANRLSGTTPLVPGQRLQIPVTNPAMIAQIVQTSKHRLIASR